MLEDAGRDKQVSNADNGCYKKHIFYLFCNLLVEEYLELYSLKKPSEEGLT